MWTKRESVEPGDRTFRIQQPLDSQLVFGYSEGVVQSLHRAQSDHLIPAESLRPRTQNSGGNESGNTERLTSRNFQHWCKHGDSLRSVIIHSYPLKLKPLSKRLNLPLVVWGVLVSKPLVCGMCVFSDPPKP